MTAKKKRSSRRKLRVLVLMHHDLVPPDDVASLGRDAFDVVKAEVDVLQALAKLGHETRNLGVHEAVRPIRDEIESWKPHIVFNLLEEFQGEAIFDQHVVSFLELLRVRYTGNNPRGLVLARDKALSKKIAQYHRILSPRFVVCRRGRKPRRPARLEFPLIVKSLVEESSMGISRASVVRDDEALADRVRFVHERIETDAIVEEFIPGRELYVGVLGNERLISLPPRELVVENRAPGEALIATARLKHNLAYQESKGVKSVAARLPEAVRARLERTSKRIYRALGLAGYARIDYRLTESGEPYFLEANPNPDISRYEEFANAAAQAGIAYPELIQRIVSLGLRR